VNEGHNKAKAIADKLAADTKKRTESQLVLQAEEYAKYAGIGMKNITAEDITPPTMFLVNKGITDKSELIDKNGNECSDGCFYIKAFKEVLKSVSGYVVWVRKDHYQAPAENAEASELRWDGSRMYRAIFVRKDTMQPIAITFKKSSLSALSDLFTISKSKNLPMFIFEVELKSVMTTNKKKQSYFKIVANVVGPEKDTKVLNSLFVMAQGFDEKEEVVTQEEESDELVQNTQEAVMDKPSEDAQPF